MSSAYTVGERVFFLGKGLGEISAYMARDAAGQPRALREGELPAFYVVQLAFGTGYVPVNDTRILRPLIPRETAEKLLEILRTPEVTPPRDDIPELQARSREVMTRGDPAEHARFLRELYAWPEPLSHAQGMAIHMYEDLVLDEAALVLGLSRDTLVAEMRQRYPALARRIEANRAR